MTTGTHQTVYENKSLPPELDRIGLILLAIGVVLVIIAFVFEPVRASFDAAILYLFMVSIAVGALFLLALEYITGAVWSVPMRRVTEFLAGLSPFLVILVLPLFLHMHDLFHWTHTEAVQQDAMLQGKTPYLNVPFFIVRTFVFLGIWVAFAMLFTRNSTRQDVTRDPALTRSSVRLAAFFLPLFAITITFTAIDWGMSLEPHWFSTIYGVYYFSGTVLAAVAAVTLIVVLFHEKGYLPGLRRDHFYSLGALMFAFVNFWAYIAFSQFLLIWYANLPGGDVLVHRPLGAWMAVCVGAPDPHEVRGAVHRAPATGGQDGHAPSQVHGRVDPGGAPRGPVLACHAHPQSGCFAELDRTRIPVRSGRHDSARCFHGRASAIILFRWVILSCSVPWTSTCELTRDKGWNSGLSTRQKWISGTSCGSRTSCSARRTCTFSPCSW